ncbi:MAG: hypothetical protein HY854_06840 [Burkholderiales bacterium]|nr:hypothetical protein [Burkholderiales bacterium]
MRMNQMHTRPAAAVTLAVFALAGASPAAAADDFFSGGCNPVVTGAIGSVFGAMIGGRSGRLGGVAIGASVGAFGCMAYNYSASQTKSSQQVGEEFKAANGGVLPTATTITRFDAAISPDANIQAGTAVDVRSQIEVVPGTNDPQPKVEQEIALFTPDGKPTGKTARKSAAQSPGGGAFETNFKFTMPQGVPQGVYPVKSQVFVNDEPAANTETKFQVVVGPGGVVVAVARNRAQLIGDKLAAQFP